MKNKKITGYLAAISSTMLLGSVGVFVRNISANGTIITFARLGAGLVFLTLFIIFRKEFKHIKETNFSFSLLLLGILMAGTSLCYVNAINSTSLANAVFLLYLAPLLAVGMAAVLLKEKFTLLSGGLLCLTFLGFLFLLEFKFSFNVNESKGYLWGIGSAICFSLYIVINRQIPDTMPALTRCFYQFLIGAVALVPFLDASLFSVTAKDIYWLIAIGFFQGFLALSLAILALKHLKAIEFGTISYIEPLVASLIGFALYSESLSVLQCIGCAIVFFGGMIQIATNKDKGRGGS